MASPCSGTALPLHVGGGHHVGGSQGGDVVGPLDAVAELVDPPHHRSDRLGGQDVEVVIRGGLLEGLSDGVLWVAGVVAKCHVFQRVLGVVLKEDA